MTAGSKMAATRGADKMARDLLCSFAVFVCVFVGVVGGTDLTDVTASLFPGGIPNHAVIAAYGDYNADKLVDIFVLSDQGRKLEVLLAAENKAYTRRTLQTFTKGVTSVIPADFNGDALMDVLVTTPVKDNVDISVCWGADDDHQQSIGAPSLVMEAWDEPTLFDYNGDMLPDLLVSNTEGDHPIIVKFDADRNSTRQYIPNMEDVKLAKNMSNAFIDVDGDFMADLVLSTESGYEFWINEGGTLNHTYTVERPAEWTPPALDGLVVGQAGFTDINQDGLPNMLVPVCKMVNKRCINSAIYGLTHPNDTLKKIYDNFKFENDKSWGFTLPGVEWPWLPITLRFGDYNMDGFPDMILFLEYGTTGGTVQKAILFQNVPCADGAEMCLLNRTFTPDLDNEISTYTGAILGSFFDLYEDGVLDILLVTVTTGKQSKNKTHVVRAIRQTSTTDACFMKVTVTNGLCYKDCLDGRQPYGVNVPGPVVRFSTVSVNGESVSSAATQLTQSTHYALQLPYVMFGLGMMPNFVDTVTVGIPVYNEKTDTVQKRDWTQIIPNAQIVVIPHPNDKPDRWVVKLFVTPSQSVLITGAALLGTCGFVAGIIGILHWQERREDMKEKRQESHKFHFDAM